MNVEEIVRNLLPRKHNNLPECACDQGCERNICVMAVWAGFL
jgi:hypothetical protein